MLSFIFNLTDSPYLFCPTMNFTDPSKAMIAAFKPFLSLLKGQITYDEFVVAHGFSRTVGCYELWNDELCEDFIMNAGGKEWIFECIEKKAKEGVKRISDVQLVFKCHIDGIGVDFVCLCDDNTRRVPIGVCSIWHLFGKPWCPSGGVGAQWTSGNVTYSLNTLCGLSGLKAVEGRAEKCIEIAGFSCHKYEGISQSLSFDCSGAVCNLPTIGFNFVCSTRKTVEWCFNDEPCAAPTCKVNPKFRFCCPKMC